MKHTIEYRESYRYVCEEDKSFQTRVKGYSVEVEDGWVRLDEDGVIHIKAGYSWNGPSGPTRDTANTMAPSLVHDGLYQIFKEALIPAKNNRKLSDLTFLDMLKDNGMSWLRRRLWYRGVRWFGWASV